MERGGGGEGRAGVLGSGYQQTDARRDHQYHFASGCLPLLLRRLLLVRVDLCHVWVASHQAYRLLPLVGAARAAPRSPALLTRCSVTASRAPCTLTTARGFCRIPLRWLFDFLRSR